MLSLCYLTCCQKSNLTINVIHNSSGNRMRGTSRSSQDNRFEAHTIPLVGIYSPGTTSSQTFTIGGSTNAGTFYVNRSESSNNDSSRDSSVLITSLSVFEVAT